MPLREFKCNDCNTVFDSVIRHQQDYDETKCPSCASKSFTENKFTTHGTYFINGDNSASERPKKSRSTL